MHPRTEAPGFDVMFRGLDASGSASGASSDLRDGRVGVWGAG